MGGGMGGRLGEDCWQQLCWQEGAHVEGQGEGHNEGDVGGSVS